MSIEGGRSIAVHKPVASDASRSGNARGVVGGAEAEGLSGTGDGFFALLSSFDSEMAVEDATTVQSVLDQPALTQPLSVDPLVNLPPQSFPNDLALLLAQAGEVSADKFSSIPADGPSALIEGASNLTPLVADLTPLSGGPSSIVPTDLSRLPMQMNEGALGQSNLIQTSGLVNPLPGSVNSPVTEGLPRGPVTTSSSIGTVGVTSGNLEALPSVNSLNPTDGFTPLTVPVDFVPVQPQGRPFKNKMGDSLSAAVSGLGEQRLQSLSASKDVMSRELSLGDTLLPSGMGESLVRQGDRRSDKPSFSSLSGSAAEAIWGQQPFQAGPVTETATVMVDSSSSSMESMVAETVSYWVAQGVKHAALKLDGFGDQPLEVNISMQGGETHIDFRTDQPEIRQILEGATPQLKDLLKNDGLVLSGVSVGASGQNGAGSQDGRNRPGARQSVTLAMGGTSEDGPRRIGQPTGRVLDLFV